MTPSDMITTKEAVEILDCSSTWVRMMAEAGEIPGAEQSPDEQWLVPRAWVLEQQKIEGCSSAEIKRASQEMGLYDIPETEFLKPTR